MAVKLAIEGGRPVREKLLPYGRQSITQDDIDAVADVLRGDWLTQGPGVDRLEVELTRLTGARHAVVFANGTAALHAAADACGLGPGDEQITSTITFLASANCAAYVGATPRLADIDLESYLVTAGTLRAASTQRTRALFPVHLAGLSCDMASIGELGRELKARVVEDACHALGATYRGAPVGGCQHSDMAVFSFHPVKHVTTAEGGAVTTNDDGLARRMRIFRNHGMERDASRFTRDDRGPWYYEMQSLGFNYRLPDLNCALGVSQLKRLPEFLERRRAIAKHYRRRLAELEGVALPPPDDEAGGTVSAYHIFVIRIDMKRLDVTKARLFEAMKGENIGVQVHYIPVHRQPYYQKTYGYRDGDFPNAEAYYQACMTLPLFPAMTDQDVDDVVQALDKVLSRYRRA